MFTLLFTFLFTINDVVINVLYYAVYTHTDTHAHAQKKHTHTLRILLFILIFQSAALRARIFVSFHLFIYFRTVCLLVQYYNQEDLQHTHTHTHTHTHIQLTHNEQVDYQLNDFVCQ